MMNSNLVLTNGGKQKTVKRRLGIVNATVKPSTSECAIGEKQTERNLVSSLVSGATENWRMEHQKKCLSIVLMHFGNQNKYHQDFGKHNFAKSQNYFLNLKNYLRNSKNCLKN